MRRFTTLSLLVALTSLSGIAQEITDPAFDPPPAPGGNGPRVRWNGSIGLVIVDGKVYQQFGLRPDIPFGKWGVGLDLTLRFNENGGFKDDEWDEPADAIEKVYYVRYGQSGDPVYVRAGALDNVTLGYGIIMKRYSNTIQYPEIKRLGLYTEGGRGRFGWQAMLNSFREIYRPGLIAGRLNFDTKWEDVIVGVTAAFDGNQYAALSDRDDDGVPDGLDYFPGLNDFARRKELLTLLEREEIDSLIAWGYIPNIRRSPKDYSDSTEAVLIYGADAAIPILKKQPVSLHLYGQVAGIADFGWGWAFPGLRGVYGPVELGFEYRQFEREFFSEFYNLSYEIERVRLVSDSLYSTKESRLSGLGFAKGFYADFLLSLSNIGYAYSWYTDMRGHDYPRGKSIYGEAGVTPPPMTRVQKIAGYYMQPNVRELFAYNADGTMIGAKLYIAIANNVSLVYDHRISYYNGERHRTVRLETMVTF